MFYVELVVVVVHLLGSMDLFGKECNANVGKFILISGANSFFTLLYEHNCFTPSGLKIMNVTEKLLWELTTSSITVLAMLTFQTLWKGWILPKLIEIFGIEGADAVTFAGQEGYAEILKKCPCMKK